MSQTIEQEPTLREKILTHKLAPIIAMTAVLGFFFYLLPDHIAEEYSILCAIVGGILTLICSFWLVGVLFPKMFDVAPVFTGILCISTLFIFGGSFIYKTVNYSTNQLRDNAVYTNATIVDKTQLYGRRGKTIQSMDIQFTDESGTSQEANIDLTGSEYSRFTKGMQIPILYSSEHPNIASIDYNKLRR